MTIKKILTLTFVLAAVILTSTSVVSAKTKQFDSLITFDKGNINPLTIGEKKTEIVVGISREDMNQFNQNPDPDSIKKFMSEIASDYGVDWKLVYAIGYHESGNYNSALARSNNNYFGRKAAGGGYASWSTPEEGIRNQFEYIKSRYFDRGMTTPATINPVYAEDSGWHYKVESVMATL